MHCLKDIKLSYAIFSLAELSCVTKGKFGGDWSRWSEFTSIFLRWTRRAASLESQPC